MNKKVINAIIKGKYLILAFLLIGVASSCDKGSDPKPDDEVVPPDDTTPTDESMFYKLHRVENYQGTQDNDGVTAAPTIFFSLETKKPVDEKYKQTNRWDVAFSSLFNSFLSGNNGTNSTNSGYGNAARGGIMIVEKPFDEVVNIPTDSEFKTAGDLIGTDDYGDYGEGMGWYLYDFYGTIMRNGAVQDAHVAYALGNPLTMKNGSIIPARTVIVRTAKGNYAKIKMISCYKDLYTPAQWYKDAPHMFFTFEYVIVPKESAKFEIK